ncbi:MAG: tRNA uridine-5-carboxymethylaminomethyl(34) synthesis GTPase MnmE, partial [Bacteroidales bacterium]|nr:tRNA uridine-5-carboxymethylaminomethyl(34) synthesis GTPase MnmE [Bacteroidales bacterium]
MLPSTICALSTVEGKGAIAVIRLSGPMAISITDSIFKPAKGAPLHKTKSYRLRFGAIYSGERMIDEVLVSLFRAPNSYTGEEMAEISCHGSYYIQQEILMLLLTKGAKLAKAGEFSQRAFLNGKMDLAQAEAVADLISSENEASHRVALQQMKGGFSKELSVMRSSLLEIVSLMELELDFAEEDVEFADRAKLKELLTAVEDHITLLIDSFRLGNVIKNGIPVAIAGATNTGKSTLLNVLLQEERAIVSDIHGTTRDYIEGYMNIDGVGFRFIDTAGIRETKETIEMIGIERSYGKIKSASIILLILDAHRPDN